ncbi:MAG: hypothetical protein U0559_01115 [Anaerolineae bacterium]
MAKRSRAVACQSRGRRPTLITIPLQVSIEFSKDDGASWSQIGSAQGSGTLDVPIEQLASSANARIRVWASDGFLSGTVTSNAFSVAAQAPS